MNTKNDYLSPHNRFNTLPEQYRGTESSEVSEKTNNLQSVKEIIKSLDGLVSNMTSGTARVVESTGNVKTAMKRLENEMEAFIISAQKDAYLYEKSLGVWEKQLDRIQDRIDQAMTKVLNLADGDFNQETVQKQKMLMDALTQINDSFNTMVVKLMAR